MFSYCGNYSTGASDPTGNAYHYVLDVETYGFLGYTLMQYTGGGSCCGGRGFSAEDCDFALIEASEELDEGTKTARILGGSIEAYSVSKDEVTLISANVSVLSLDYYNDDVTISLFNLGNAEVSAGLDGIAPYAELMISVWSPSVSFEIGRATVTIGAHIGAWGAGVSLVPDKWKFSYANGIGGFIEIS